MANIKITDLTAYTDPLNTDVLPIVDVTSDTTKKVSIADLLENAGSGTAAAPGIAFDGDSNTGIYRPGADQLAVATNGSARLYITSDGKVGIGATSPAGKLQVITGGSGGNVLIDAESSSAFHSKIVNGAGDLIVGSRNATGDTLLVSNRSIIFKGTSGESEVGRFDSAGRLLVGTSTSASTAGGFTPSIQVAGTGALAAMSAQRYVASANGPGFVFQKSRSGTIGSQAVLVSGDVLGVLTFEGSDGSAFQKGVEIRGEVDGTPGANDMPGRLVFSTNGGASSPTERMRITSDGVVGIHDATPNTSYYLNVTYNPNDKGCVYLEDFAYYTSQHALVVNNLDTNPGRAMSDVRFERNGAEVGFIKINSASVTYSTTSDYRVKENIVPLVDATSRLKQLQVKRFNFISDPERIVDGFIAHEAQAVVPEAVSGIKDETKDLGNIVDATGEVVATAVDQPLPEHLQNGHTWTKTHTIDVHQGIDQAKLVPLLTAALQEAIGEIESLKARVAALESA